MSVIDVDLVGGAAAGPSGRRRVSLERRDVLSTIFVTVVEDEGRVVVLSTKPSKADVRAGYGRWTTYYLWPRTDPSRPVEYRAEKPPRSAHGATFSASA